ncbi:MAG: cobalamin biosynthesis protein [Syntrophales bacterium]|nr:cobalamin biosynthesis protein [Syntrophales bacterium]MDP3097484.1 cobalamin biosynthesis protein [Syntrophales bacterium]
MKTALITLSDAGARLLAPLTGRLPEARLFIHESVRDESIRCGTVLHETARRDSAPHEANRINSESELEAPAAERFTKITDLTATLFPVCRGLVYAAPCGVVVRAIAPLVKSKYEDTAVVVLDVGGRWAVSLLAGHEGGANDLAIRVANLTGAEPVVTTTTEALKSVIVGIGCRRGTPAERIVAAIREALTEAGVALEEVRLLASAEVKADEAGLLTAAETLGVPIRFIAAEEIRSSLRDFSHSDFVAKKVNLPAVAEPAALLAGTRTRFICRKKTFSGITIALAREGFPWSESAPANR